jgi:hypothetical protein
MRTGADRRGLPRLLPPSYRPALRQGNGQPIPSRRDCEDDADRLAQEIQGYVGTGAAVRVQKTVLWMPGSADLTPPMGGV